MLSKAADVGAVHEALRELQGRHGRCEVGGSVERTAILDIAGVPNVDTQVADALLKAARGVQLLGAEVVLTGIRPEVAQTLVALGVELTGTVTRGTLQDGIRYAVNGARSWPGRRSDRTASSGSAALRR